MRENGGFRKVSRGSVEEEDVAPCDDLGEGEREVGERGGGERGGAVRERCVREMCER